MRKKEISMIILAGGASSRMGRDKSDLTIDFSRLCLDRKSVV